MTPFCFFPILAGFGSCAKLYGNSGSCRMNRWGTVDFSNHPDETANSQALKQSFPIRFRVWGRWFSLNFPFCLLEKCGFLRVRFLGSTFLGPMLLRGYCLICLMLVSGNVQLQHFCDIACASPQLMNCVFFQFYCHLMDNGFHFHQYAVSALVGGYLVAHVT